MNVSTSALGVRRRRPTQNIDDEENATLLKLGPEFDLKQINHDGEEEDLIALNLSEARVLIRTALKQRKIANSSNNYDENLLEDDDNENENEDDVSNIALAPNANEVLHKTLNYLTNFARFRSSASTQAVEELLSNESYKNSLHPFEIAQLGSLTCDEVDEAKTLIPSLANKITDNELQNLLNELRRLETPY